LVLLARLLHKLSRKGIFPFIRQPRATTTMFDRLDNELRPQQAALNVRAYRQELLASNIANADTPYYKARDVDFKAAYQSALDGRGEGGLNLNRTAAKHLPGEAGSPLAGALRYRTEYQSAVDGNTVNMDIERAAFAENAIQMEAMLTFINGRFRTLQTAIQGQ
jgi:flagellar basal-body rod protein FlgB